MMVTYTKLPTIFHKITSKRNTTLQYGARDVVTSNSCLPTSHKGIHCLLQRRTNTSLINLKVKINQILRKSNVAYRQIQFSKKEQRKSLQNHSYKQPFSFTNDHEMKAYLLFYYPLKMTQPSIIMNDGDIGCHIELLGHGHFCC